MKLLLDESVNTRLRYCFPDHHDVRTVEYMGWKGIGNGELLALARQDFEVLITRDQNISQQQNITTAEIPIIVLYPSSNRVIDLVPLVPEVLEILSVIRRGQVIPIYPPKQTQD